MKAEDRSAMNKFMNWVLGFVRSDMKDLRRPMFSAGKLATAPAETVSGNGKWRANVYIDGQTTATPNVPVNPAIASSLAIGNEVLVLNVNGNPADRIVDMKRPV